MEWQKIVSALTNVLPLSFFFSLALTARNLTNFHTMSDAISEVCPNLEHLVLTQPNVISGLFMPTQKKNGEDSYRWPLYFPINCLALPKLKTLNISGFAFVEDTKLNLPELTDFRYKILYPSKLTLTTPRASGDVLLTPNITEAHETQRETDRATIEAIKEDIEANCPKLKPNGVKVEFNIRNNNSRFAVVGFRLAELSKKSFAELQTLGEAE